MAEIAGRTIVLVVPIVGEFKERGAFRLCPFAVTRRRKKDEGVAPALIVYAPDFLEPELPAVEVEALVQTTDAYHRVQISHLLSLRPARAPPSSSTEPRWHAQW